MAVYWLTARLCGDLKTRKLEFNVFSNHRPVAVSQCLDDIHRMRFHKSFDCRASHLIESSLEGSPSFLNAPLGCFTAGYAAI